MTPEELKNHGIAIFSAAYASGIPKQHNLQCVVITIAPDGAYVPIYSPMAVSPNALIGILTRCVISIDRAVHEFHNPVDREIKAQDIQIEATPDETKN